MANHNQKTEPRGNRAVMFIDFRPGELHKGKEWIIRYYCKNPLDQTLNLKRMRVPPASNTTERTKIARRMIAVLNSKLEMGWTPWHDEAQKQFKSFETCAAEFLSNIKKDFQKGGKRFDTVRTYTSYLCLMSEFRKKQKRESMLVGEWDKPFTISYLDWIYYERKNSTRTYNNHLQFLRSLAKVFIDRGFLSADPTLGILKKRNAPKKRQILPDHLKKLLREKLAADDPEYFVLCMCTYYAMIRRTELTKIRVENIDLERHYFYLPHGISKNKKDEYVTIPPELAELLKKHIGNAGPTNFVFGADLKPGTKPVSPKTISYRWEKLQAAYGIDKKYQFYSLKDTGITDLLRAGIPSISVRDQARHYDLKITETYTPRATSHDPKLIQSGVFF